MGFLIAVMMTGSWFFVYATGGTRFGFLHVIYLPIILAGMVGGFKGGVASGIIAGLILGPLMPLNTQTMESQPLFNWGLRMVFFILAGGFVGYVFHMFRLKDSKLKAMYTHDHSTGIETLNSYWSRHPKNVKNKDRVSMSLHINNYDSLVVLLGMDEYTALLKNIHERLKAFLPEKTSVYLRDRRLLWIDMSAESFKTIRDDFAERIERDIIYSETVPLFLDFSVGLSFPGHPKTILEQFKESDIAALHAAKQGVNMEVFHEDLREDTFMLERLANMPRALEKDEFHLVYQPIMNLKDNTIVGVEALIRWRYGDAMLTPDQFIPLAEETKLIDHITEWVLDAALKDYERFREVKDSIEIAINVSYRNLFNPGLIERMVERIEKSKLLPDRLHIEMTESTLMRNRTSTQAFLSSFRALGVSTILDDFGTGYSSLSCLRDLPVDSVKIDREFTMNIHEDKGMYDMIATIIELAHKMDLRVIAEGVEEKSVLDELKRLGCDYVQGYYFSKPLDNNDVEAFIKKYNS